MGVNFNSLIWGVSPRYYQCSTPSDATISSHCGGQPYQDNTATPNPRIQDHEDVFKATMTVKNIYLNQIIKWFDLISVCRLTKSHGIQYNYKHCKTWYGYHILSNMTQPRPPMKTIQFVKIKIKSFNKSRIDIWTHDYKITSFSHEDHTSSCEGRSTYHSLVDFFYCALIPNFYKS